MPKTTPTRTPAAEPAPAPDPAADAGPYVLNDVGPMVEKMMTFLPRMANLCCTFMRHRDLAAKGDNVATLAHGEAFPNGQADVVQFRADVRQALDLLRKAHNNLARAHYLHSPRHEYHEAPQV